MDLSAIFQSVNDSIFGEWMRMNVKALPIVNALHVIAIITVFGTILIVDLRLLGFPNTRRSFTRTAHELLRWTWAAFAISAATGALMLTANANTYYENAAFWLKMLVILLAGVNMAVFELVVFRGVAAWDKDATPPLPARIAGALSILLWTAVIVLGRVIGFTKGYVQAPTPEEMDSIDFDFSALHSAPQAALDWAASLANHFA